MVGPLPRFVDLIGPAADPTVFFAGSLFFTTAAGLQCLETFNADRAPGGATEAPFRIFAFEPARIDWWSSVVQFVGTLFFNVMTFRALDTALENPSYDRLVWAPDVFGRSAFSSPATSRTWRCAEATRAGGGGASTGRSRP